MPAVSQKQFKFIQAMRSKYGSKSNAPEDKKWVFDKEWTDVDYKKLPEQEQIDIIQSLFNDILEVEKVFENSLQKVHIGNFREFRIYTVNGSYIRRHPEMDVDFEAGGNDKAYGFIPEYEIWLDNDLDRSEYKYILCHEYIERWFMKNKDYDYDKAHIIANRYEMRMRRKY